MRLRSLMAAYIFAGRGQAPVQRAIQRDPSLSVTMAGAPVERLSERHVSGTVLRAWRCAPSRLNVASIEAMRSGAD